MGIMTTLKKTYSKKPVSPAGGHAWPTARAPPPARRDRAPPERPAAWKAGGRDFSLKSECPDCVENIFSSGYKLRRPTASLEASHGM